VEHGAEERKNSKFFAPYSIFGFFNFEFIEFIKSELFFEFF